MTKAEVARRYARALVKSAVDYVRVDTNALREILHSSEEFRQLLSNPLIPPKEKSRIIREMFEGKLHTVTLNFLDTLVERRREKLLPEILNAFQDELDRFEGTLVVKAVTAVSMTQEQMERLEDKIASLTGRRVRLETNVDPSIKGGILIKIGDRTIDATIDTAFQKLRENLIKRVR
ncbi:TPA: ATP synthase F1 subunit delta [Candidatus Poribacteria bacterium]|nr:ATP synthase F1 subunit delta [Candidatus Poribacteria bacterium]HEX29122.1 ATP synthase F1 subunit delta [Candidatus Poribacteria bacterium]